MNDPRYVERLSPAAASPTLPCRLNFSGRMQVLGNRDALYLPSALEWRFARFSNPELLKKANTQAVLRDCADQNWSRFALSSHGLTAPMPD